ncbi:hypothetical protein PMAYCL1PPCAC_20364, partial [Pristionchus mayeri]
LLVHVLAAVGAAGSTTPPEQEALLADVALLGHSGVLLEPVLPCVDRLPVRPVLRPGCAAVPLDGHGRLQLLLHLVVMNRCCNRLERRCGSPCHSTRSP